MVSRLVAGISEGKERICSYIASLQVCETHNHLDTFPQLIVYSSSTILHSID